eukprot:m.304773 g.304773  ORF g.304773 m.304773 type:complete len:128 (-) comp16339_c0_seq20:5516-5899(-)
MGGHDSSYGPPNTGGCSAAHSTAVFTMGFGAGMLFLLVTGGGGPLGALPAVREKLSAAAEAFQARVARNLVLWASVAQVMANTCFGVGSVIGKMGKPKYYVHTAFSTVCKVSSRLTIVYILLQGSQM